MITTDNIFISFLAVLTLFLLVYIYMLGMDKFSSKFGISKIIKNFFSLVFKKNK